MAKTEKRKEHDKRYRQKHKSHKKLRDKLYHQKREYGLTLAELENIRIKQNGICPICRRNLNDVQPCTDHNHLTGIVRGILCRNCNTALGFLNDNIGALMNAIDYLRAAEQQGAM